MWWFLSLCDTFFEEALEKGRPSSTRGKDRKQKSGGGKMHGGKEGVASVEGG